MFTKFNRVLLASGLAIGSALLPVTAMAQDITSGGAQEYEVPLVTEITYTPAAQIAPTLPNTAITAPESVGSLVIKSNNAAGFTVSANSENAGAFKSTFTTPTGAEGANVNHTIKYTFYYAGGDKSFTDTSDVQMESPTFTADCADASGCTRLLTVTVAADETGNLAKPAGVYSDTITFKIVNK